MLPDPPRGFFSVCSRCTEGRPDGPGVALCAGVPRASGAFVGVDSAPADDAGVASDPPARRALGWRVGAAFGGIAISCAEDAVGVVQLGGDEVGVINFLAHRLVYLEVLRMAVPSAGESNV